MGMFDCVSFQDKTPYGMGDDSQGFQTKSLDCLLNNYEISPEGRLLLIPMGTKTPVDTNYDGELEMCGARMQGVLLTYTLLFVEGTLIEIQDHHHGTTLYLAASPSALLV